MIAKEILNQVNKSEVENLVNLNNTGTQNAHILKNSHNRLLGAKEHDCTIKAKELFHQKSYQQIYAEKVKGNVVQYRLFQLYI